MNMVTISYHPTIFLVLVLATGCQVAGNREHKVHNIVLYPDKHSWCTTLPIKQVISAETDGSCKSIEIDNNVCVGACFSYSIPRTEPNEGEVIIPYCDSCQPFETKWENVTLSCQQSGPDFEQSQIIVKRVQIITNCSCSSCSAEQSPPSSGTNYPSHLLIDDSNQRSAAQKNDLPDLLNQQFEASSNSDDYPVDASLEENNDVQQQHHHLANEIPQFHPTTSHQVRTENIKAMLNNRLISLLKNIQEKNSHYDKKELVELLKIIQGPDQTLSDKNIVDFVESLNSEHIELDIPRLKEILMKVEHEKHHQHHHHEHQHHPDASHELELLPEKEGGHLKSTYIGMGHLKKGPHNALVIEPDDKSLIDVNSNDLKPNHAGTLLSYHHQHHQSQKK